MSLSFSSVSTSLSSFYQTQHNDIIIPPANTTSGGVQSNYVNVPSPADEWVLNFQDVYFADAQAAIPSQPSVLIADGADKALLYFSVLNGIGTATNKARAITDYWSAKLAHGTPIMCGVTIVSITNDASKIFTPIEGYMLGLTSVLTTPSYEHLYSFIETQVKSIIWTVTELDGALCADPTSYPVTVS
jgi:hypothetical protein